VAAACYSGPGRDHFAVITPPIRAVREGRLREDVTRVTQLVARELEGLIRRAPEQWHVLQPRFEGA
jgi:lauroyl/myristoyl acyltransferase